MFASFRFLSQFTQSPNGYLCDGEGDPGAPAGGVNPAPAAPAAATPTAAASPAASSQVSQQTPASPSVPDGYVPAYRIRETREAAFREAQQRANAEIQNIRAEMERYQNQVRALVGANPQQTTEADQIKQQFFQLFPWAQKLEQKFGDIESLIERAGDLESQTNHYWTSYGRQTMDRLFSLASESLGAPLTDEGKRQLHSSFVGFVQSSPELTARYAQDPTIVEDFWKSFTSAFVDPARRASSAQVATRAAAVASLPVNSPSGAPQTTPAPKPSGLDERAALAWTEFKNRTGQS